MATTAGPGPSPEPDRPQAVGTKQLTGRETRSVLSFPARRVAEQLTLMDVVSGGALGVLWARPPLGHQLPGPPCHDLNPKVSSPPFATHITREVPQPEAFAVHLRTLRWARQDLLTR